MRVARRIDRGHGRLEPGGVVRTEVEQAADDPRCDPRRAGGGRGVMAGGELLVDPGCPFPAQTQLLPTARGRQGQLHPLRRPRPAGQPVPHVVELVVEAPQGLRVSGAVERTDRSAQGAERAVDRPVVAGGPVQRSDGAADRVGHLVAVAPNGRRRVQQAALDRRSEQRNEAPLGGVR